jgi:hypothetical protein
MDLQAAQAAREKRGLLSKLTTLLCLALASALLVGSLMNSSRASPNLPIATINLGIQR